MRAIKATSYVLVLKGAVAGSVAALALAGVTVPYASEFLGFDQPSSVATDGIAATVGAILGVFAAMKG
jgi:hypothetical protein